MEIKEYQNLDEQLLSEWQQLWDKSANAHFTNHPAWFCSHKKVFLDDSGFVVTVWDGNELVAVLPLCRQKKLGIKTITSFGGEYTGKLPLLVKDDDLHITNLLIGYLFREKSFYLPEASEDLAKAISQSNKDITICQASVSHYFPLDQESLYYFSKKRRARVLSRVRRFGDRLSFKSYREDLQALEEAFALDEKSAKRKKGMMTFTSEQDKEFYRQLVRNFKDRMAVDMMYFQGEPFVFSINFLYGKTYHFYKTAFHSQYEYLVPGKLLLYYVFPKAQNEGFEKFDFSRGTSRFKKEFTPLFYRQYDLFFVKNFLIKWWWKLSSAAMRLKTEFYENEKVYRKYFAVKRLFVKQNATQET